MRFRARGETKYAWSAGESDRTAQEVWISHTWHTCRHLAVSLLFSSAVIVVSLQQWKAFMLLGRQWAEGNFCCTYTWGLCNQTSESLALTANRANLFLKMHLLIIILSLFIFKVCFMLVALRQMCIDIPQAGFSSINSAQIAWHMDNIHTLFCSLRCAILVFYKLHTGVLHSWEKFDLIK